MLKVDFRMFGECQQRRGEDVLYLVCLCTWALTGSEFFGNIIHFDFLARLYCGKLAKCDVLDLTTGGFFTPKFCSGVLGVWAAASEVQSACSHRLQKQT